MIYVTDHQTKAQFVAIAGLIIGSGLVKPSALELAKKYYDEMDRRSNGRVSNAGVNQLSIRDLAEAIIPAIHAYDGRVIIAIDDLAGLTPTRGQRSGCRSRIPLS
ncbi:MAG: hypothetical protein R3F37_16640 [Candidatus Competibacteraceae bacterium]